MPPRLLLAVVLFGLAVGTPRTAEGAVAANAANGGALPAAAAPSGKAANGAVLPAAAPPSGKAANGAILPAAAAPAAAAGGGTVYTPPVPGRVARGFDAPAMPYGAGHRGVDLAVGHRAPVRTAGAGVVTFAGKVAGRGWVSVDHADGIRTTYGALDEVRFGAGDRVGVGVVLGFAAGSPHPGDTASIVHWGARRGGIYLDPMLLLEPWRPALVGPGGWRTSAVPERSPYAQWDGRRAWYEPLVPASPQARGPGWDLPPNPNVAIGVAGLGSTSDSVPLDLTQLGYDRSSVAYLSYGDPDPASVDWTVRPAYDAEDTWRGVARAAGLLEQRLRSAERASPGRAVDLVGHSLGGVVVAYYLLFLHDPADPGLPPLDHVVTIAAPLEGADLADVALAGARDRRGGALLAVARDRFDLPPAESRTMGDLAVGSALLRALAERWAAASEDVHRGPLATGTSVLTLGAQADLVVAEHRSDLPGAPHAVLPGGHDSARATEASRLVLRAFLADEPIPAEAGGLGHLASYWWSGATQVIGRTVLGGWGPST